MFFFLITMIVFTAGITYQRLTYAQKATDVTRKESPRQVLIELDHPEWRVNLPLPALVNQSAIIAIGEPIRNACRQSQTGDVTTDYEVRVHEVIKGPASPEMVISVKMPGGIVTQSDGTVLEARSRFVRRMQDGKRYVMFLERSRHGNESYAPIRGSQGLFEIPPTGGRVIHLGRSFFLPPADDGELISVFLQQVREKVKKR